ncbi:nuclear transport factor 2 family protein [Marinimicrobium sp. ABcell2]|uniref:nuclear transport factor 2 family protein n=1 Tax=Marinimicrobium sp. ABcell2 TaxID=3069751 RepID=UPI0027B53217|nr:nuclear transport factor 2 family protein [Marinimicrobium sp. ABcell2]MDQ2077751.1 nuclear transport factor 2 family protein [Marinimicrobium sp. ABcell2]
MKKYLSTIVLYVLVTVGAQANEYDRVLLSIETLFSAISAGDLKAMEEQVTPEFILAEHGEVWDIGDLMDVVSATKATRTNYFSVIRVDVYEHIAVANYWNKANFQIANINEDVIWLESAVLQNIDDDWVLFQMHSTRLPSETVPEGVVFTRDLLQMPSYP